MKLICGLGNPGIKYRDTRHNVGFIVLWQLCKDLKAVRWNETRNYVAWKWNEGIFVFPQTYMNLSGLALQEAVAVYNIELHNLLVVLDDINLPLGQMRIREKGSNGGHNGLKSIIYILARDEFARLRIGIGPSQSDEISVPLEDYVLAPFLKQEMDILNKIMPDAIMLLKAFLKSGYQGMSDEFSKIKQTNSLSLPREQSTGKDCDPHREEINNRKEKYGKKQNL